MKTGAVRQSIKSWNSGQKSAVQGCSQVSRASFQWPSESAHNELAGSRADAASGLSEDGGTGICAALRVGPGRQLRRERAGRHMACWGMAGNMGNSGRVDDPHSMRGWLVSAKGRRDGNVTLFESEIPNECMPIMAGTRCRAEYELNGWTTACQPAAWPVVPPAAPAAPIPVASPAGRRPSRCRRHCRCRQGFLL